MPYSTLDDLKKIMAESEIIELTNDSESVFDIDDDVYESARDEADETIKGYLRGVYTLEFDSTPLLIKGLSVRITKFLLYRRRDQLSEAQFSLYKEDIKTLEKIQDGTTKLDATSEAKAFDRVKVNSEDQVYTSDLFDKFRSSSL